MEKRIQASLSLVLAATCTARITPIGCEAYCIIAILMGWTVIASSKKQRYGIAYWKI